MPPGWDYWAGRDTAGSDINENGNVRDYSGQFMTDVYKDKALAFLKQATDRRGTLPSRYLCGPTRRTCPLNMPLGTLISTRMRS